MKIQKMKIPAILGALLLAGTLSAGAQMNSDSLYKEPYRPQYHFSPEKGWIGDPRDSCTIRVNIICTGGAKSNLQIWYITSR